MSTLHGALSRIRFLIVVISCSEALAVANHPLLAKEAPEEAEFVEGAQELAVASDREPTSAAEVAREVLRLQQQLGGSIVTDRPQLQSFPPQEYQPPHYLRVPDTTLLTWPEEQALATDRGARQPQRFTDQSPRVKVSQLRETALLLDTKAHHLEELDLYEQADALREVATRLRHDAREMKREAAAAATVRPRYLVPTTPTERFDRK